jgi:hypothetical protein
LYKPGPVNKPIPLAKVLKHSWKEIKFFHVFFAHGRDLGLILSKRRRVSRVWCKNDTDPKEESGCVSSSDKKNVSNI